MLDSCFEFSQLAMKDGRGGARQNAGRKTQSVEDASGDSHAQYAVARAKKEKHQANIKAIEEKVLRSKLVEVEKVEKQADRAARLVRDAFLNLPDRISSLLVGRSESEILNLLRSEVRETLTQVATKMNGKET